MAVFEDAEYVLDAVRSVRSILDQTFVDFELVVVDDCGSDGSIELVEAIADSRVSIERNSTNLGLTRSLNVGLGKARGRYLARMDADDIAMPDRLARQVAFLDGHPEIAIVGGACELIDDVGRSRGMRILPPTDLGIRWLMLFGSPFAHPAVMIRRDVLSRHGLEYDPAFRTAQDYDLWVRLLALESGANLLEPLLKYRLRQGVSSRHREDQLRNHGAIQRRALDALVPGLKLTRDEAHLLRQCFVGDADLPRGQAGRALLEQYLGLLLAFARRYHDRVDMPAIVIAEVRKLARLVPRRPSAWMSPRVAARLLGVIGQVRACAAS
jgi:glycosyltransferase involved in cell wall biosynthesis